MKRIEEVRRKKINEREKKREIEEEESEDGRRTKIPKEQSDISLV